MASVFFNKSHRIDVTLKKTAHGQVRRANKPQDRIQFAMPVRAIQARSSKVFREWRHRQPTPSKFSPELRADNTACIGFGGAIGNQRRELLRVLY
jgi:hypothetical protein